jgi:hypothetical protein
MGRVLHSTMKIEARKVRKGMLIQINGKQGPRLVTKREKWNSTHCRIYYAPAPLCFDGAPGFEYVPLDDLFLVYQPEE